jgi:hypothetical protein
MNKFYDAFFENNRLRWNAFGIAGAITLVHALFQLWVVHRTEEMVYSEVVWVLLSSIILVLVVCFVRRANLVARPQYNPRYQLFGGTIAVLALIGLLNVDVPSVQSRVADYTLRRAFGVFGTVQASNLSVTQVQSRFRKIQTIVSSSTANQIPVNPATLNTAQATLSGYLNHSSLPEQTKQDAWRTTIDLQSLSLNRQAESGAISSRQISTSGLSYASFVRIDYDVYFKGDHTSITFNGGGIDIENATAVFDKIDFQATGAAFPLIVGKDAKVFVIDSIFQGGLQTLDNITWSDVQFRDTQLRYSGGAIRLRNVSFTETRIEHIVTWGLPIELDNLILKSNSQPISYVYEPPIVEKRID